MKSSSSSSSSSFSSSPSEQERKERQEKKEIPLPLKVVYKDETLELQLKGMGINGLQNLGNTCYMNSILQCLIHTPWLVKYMLTDKFHQHVKQNSLEMIMVYEINKLLRFMYYSSGQTLNPIQFFQYMQMLSMKLGNGQFLGNKQHDACEFLTFVLDILHEGLAKPINLPEQILKNNEVHFKSWIQTFKNSYSILVKEIFGQFHTRTICTNCRNISSNYDPFSILHLPIPVNKKQIRGNNNNENIGNNNISLKDCFDLFSQEEELDNDNKYRCERCKQLNNAHKMTEIWKAPDTLIVCLKRFNKNGTKINTNISFPLEEFKLSTVNGEKKLYDLYAVCNHIGDLNSGHYFSYIKQDSGIGCSWFEMNDGSIRMIPHVNRVINHYAYILFFKARNNEKKRE